MFPVRYSSAVRGTVTQRERRVSDVFQRVLTLWTLQPGGGPAGFDAGSFLQTVVVRRQFGVTLFSQPAEWRAVTEHALLSVTQLNTGFRQFDPLTQNGRDKPRLGKQSHQPGRSSFLPGTSRTPVKQQRSGVHIHDYYSGIQQ